MTRKETPRLQHPPSPHFLRQENSLVAQEANKLAPFFKKEAGSPRLQGTDRDCAKGQPHITSAISGANLSTWEKGPPGAKL